MSLEHGHLTQETLWEAATVPLEGDDYAHLQLCTDCRLELDNVKFARGLLDEPPAPPALSDDAAKRIGSVLRKAAEKEARRRYWWHAWWPFNFSPTWAFAPVAAAMLAFIAYRLTAPQPSELSPVAKRDDVIVPMPKSPTPPPMPEAPHPLPVKKVFASVKSSKNAKSGAATLKKAQQVTEGSVVATAKGGSLLMTLPDGSQLGLASASQVTLAQLEDKAVTLEVDRGSLNVVARHDPTRELRVRAGELEIIDVGTEFLVSREDGRTLVAVEEGAVDVKAGSETVAVKAGQAVEYKDGQLVRRQWAQADEQPAPLPRKVAVAPKPAAKLHAEEATPEIPSEAPKAAPPAPEPVKVEPAVAPAPEEKTASSPDEWATNADLKGATVNTPPPVPQPEPLQPQPPPPAPTTEPASQGMAPQSEDEANVSLLEKLRRKIHGVNEAFKGSTRQQRADEIAAAANRSQCSDVLALADRWLGEPVPRGEGFVPRRSVLSSKLRCLSYLGRTGDAEAVQRELDQISR